MPVSPIPAGYSTVTPYLMVRDASRAIEFYCQVFGAREIMRLPGPDGKIGHAELRIGDSVIMLADECPQALTGGPQSLGGTSVGFLLYVDDVDTRFPKAIAAGGKERRPIKTQFYGDRSGSFEDPFGHVWTIATHVEDVTPEEMDRRMKAMST